MCFKSMHVVQRRRRDCDRRCSYKSLKHVLSAAASRTRKVAACTPMIGEGELWLDPLQIKQVAYTLERIVNVETELRAGQGSDEMTRYRYDVIIRLDTDDRTIVEPVTRYSYQHERLYEQDLSQWLASAPSAFVLTGVPNARISLDLQLSRNAPQSSQTKLTTPNTFAAGPPAAIVKPGCAGTIVSRRNDGCIRGAA